MGAPLLGGLAGGMLLGGVLGEHEGPSRTTHSVADVQAADSRKEHAELQKKKHCLLVHAYAPLNRIVKQNMLWVHACVIEWRAADARR